MKIKSTKLWKNKRSQSNLPFYVNLKNYENKFHKLQNSRTKPFLLCLFCDAIIMATMVTLATVDDDDDDDDVQLTEIKLWCKNLWINEQMLFISPNFLIGFDSILGQIKSKLVESFSSSSDV